MSLSKEDLAGIMEIIGQAEEFRPLVKSVIELAGDFGGELRPVLESLRGYIVESRIASIKQFMNADFTKDEAITMTMDEAFAVRRIFQNAGNKNQK